MEVKVLTGKILSSNGLDLGTCENEGTTISAGLLGSTYLVLLWRKWGAKSMEFFGTIERLLDLCGTTVLLVARSFDRKRACPSK